MTYRLVPEEQRLMIISITNAHDIFWLKQKKNKLVQYYMLLYYYYYTLLYYKCSLRIVLKIPY